MKVSKKKERKKKNTHSFDDHQHKKTQDAKVKLVFIIVLTYLLFK